MNRVSKLETFFYAIFYAVFIIGYQIYCKELENQRPSPVSYEARRILWGFYNPQGTDYFEVVRNLEVAPYFAAYCLICLLINMFNVPNKIQFAEFASVGLMTATFGVTLTGVIMVIMIAMAILGRCLRGIKVVPQVVGLLVLAFVGKWLEQIKWLNFREHVTSSSLTYAGFYAHVVRAVLICCDYAGESEPFSWKRLFSESIGYPAFTNVFMPASFFLFTDWKQWREGKHEFIWKGPFKLVTKKRIGKATVMRTLSPANLFLRILQVAFWCFIDKYFLCAVDLINVLTPIVDRALTDRILVSDWGVFSYATYITLLRFNVYYVIFYNISRLVGDFQQFLLSPAFSPDLENLVGGDTNAMKVWKKATLVERLFRVEIEAECLMPEGPCFLVNVETSSEVWRKFDIGLYNVLKYYIYIPWMSVVMKMFIRGSESEKQRLSPLLSNFAAVCGAAFTFIFVLTFHHWTKGNQIWVTTSFTLWIIERTVTQANRKQGISDYLERHFSPAWEQRIRCAASAVLQVVNALSFYCFVTNFESGWFVIRTMISHPCLPLILALVIYCPFNVKCAINE